MDLDTGINAGNLAIAAASFGAGIATEIISRHASKYTRSEDYLDQCIRENGVITQDDLDIAARLYLIPQYRKRCRSMAKVIAKANPMCDEYGKKTNKKPKDVDDDWLTYFLDRAYSGILTFFIENTVHRGRRNTGHVCQCVYGNSLFVAQLYDSFFHSLFDQHNA